MKETNCMFSCIFVIKEYIDLVERHNSLKSDFWPAKMICTLCVYISKKIYRKKNNFLRKYLFYINKCYNAVYSFTNIHVFCVVF